jgi:hypothetical protein
MTCAVAVKAGVQLDPIFHKPCGPQKASEGETVATASGQRADQNTCSTTVAPLATTGRGLQLGLLAGAGTEAAPWAAGAAGSSGTAAWAHIKSEYPGLLAAATGELAGGVAPPGMCCTASLLPGPAGVAAEACGGCGAGAGMRGGRGAALLPAAAALRYTASPQRRTPAAGPSTRRA